MTDAAPLDIAGGEDEEDTPWRSRAACRNLDATLWYPPKGRTAKQGREICAACPVSARCLEHAIETFERQGLWGGSSDRQRRRLRMIWVQRAHNYRSDCTNPDCRWCRTVDAHLHSLREPQGPQNINGAGVRHGFKSTYARGCRCKACGLTVSADGARIRLHGFSVHWWVQWFGPVFEDRLFWYAERLAEPGDVDSAVAS